MHLFLLPVSACNRGAGLAKRCWKSAAGGPSDMESNRGAVVCGPWKG